MIKNAGKPSVKSLKLICSIFFIIRAPSIIRIGAIAAFGIIFINGINSNDNKNSNPVIKDERPVLPPAAIPAIPSTVETEGLVPKRPQNIVERAVALRAGLNFSSALSIPTWPCIKPIFSNISTNANEKVAIQNEDVDILLKLTFKNNSL